MKPLEEFKRDISNCDVLNVIQISKNFFDDDVLNRLHGYETYIDTDPLINDRIYSINMIKEDIMNSEINSDLHGKFETLYFALFNFDYFMIIE